MLFQVDGMRVVGINFLQLIAQIINCLGRNHSSFEEVLGEYSVQSCRFQIDSRGILPPFLVYMENFYGDVVLTGE